MSGDSQSDLFITEINSECKTTKDFEDGDLLAPVRKDHLKIREVVNAFRTKVDRLIDKQRLEYVQAYENHMQDVQKELHILREKVFEIANDETKNERTEKLKSDLESYRREATQLESEADSLRISMSSLVRRINTVEHSRDWMLKKLRQAKKQYNFLILERSRIGDNGSQLSLSNCSSFAVDVDHGDDKFKKVATTALRMSAVIRQPLPSVKSGKIKSPVLAFPESQPGLLSDSLSELSSLLAARLSKDELREFLQTCKKSLHKRPWSKISKSGYQNLLRFCELSLQDANLLTEELLLPLACELACWPNVYDALTNCLLHSTEQKLSTIKNVEQKPNAVLLPQSLLTWSC